MKETIRLFVFETNSSAVHSIAVAGELEPNKMPMKNGYIMINFGNYGDYDEGRTIFSQSEKLSYLATECYYLNHWDEDLSDFYTWRNISDAVCKYTGAKGICIVGDTEPELNYQAIPEYDLKFCNDWDEDSVINFIFNPNVGIKMSHD